MKTAPPLRIFELRRHGWLATGLALAMIGVAATESIGLMLLAPMLIALGESGPGLGGGMDQAGAIPHWLVTLGVPLGPGPLLAIFVSLAVLRATVMQARTLLGQSFEVSIVDGLRARAWNALLRCDWRVLAAMRQSDNATLLISEVDRVGTAVNQAVAGIAIAVTLGGVGLAALALSPRLALGMALAGLLLLLAYRRLRSNARSLGEEMSEAHSEVFSSVNQGLGAFRVIKSFGKESEVVSELMHGFAGLRATQRKFLLQSGLGQAGVQIAGSLVIAACVWAAIAWKLASPVTILPIAAMFARALPLLGTLQLNWQTWAHCRPAMDRTLALIAQAEAAREDDAAAVAPPPFAKSITLAGVTVRFPGRADPVLQNVSLTIPSGRIALITGPSGAGKSTLADLVGGLISPDDGTVAIDGVRLEGGLRRAWRARVAYVQQDPVLFDGAIRDNLRWAKPDASDQSLFRVLNDASAQFVGLLPQGLDTPVGEGGQRLSGGERQRILLARALLRSPDLLILDEATSALDSDNDVAIAQAVERLRGRLTVLIIGHRGALQEIADLTFRFDNGCLIDAANREEGD
jgi:ATP-binding cassette subfamily C protein